MENFGQRLKEERERLKMTQADFAAACGVGKTAQYTYEANDRHPDVVYLGAAMAVGVDVGYLLTGSRKQQGQAYALSKIVDGVGEEIVLNALGSLDLDGFLDSIEKADIDAATRLNPKPMLQKLIANTPDLLALFDARPVIDSDLLERVLIEIEHSASAQALSVDKKARIAALAYRLALKHGQIDRTIIEEASALAKS